MRVLLALVLTALGLAALALSAWINASAGHAVSNPAEASRQLAALFVLIDLGKVGLLTAATVLFAERARMMAFGLALAGVVLLAMSFANVAGRIAQLRASEAGAIATGATLIADALEELTRLKEKLAALGPVAPEAAIRAELEALETDRRWRATAACTDATVTESRRFCSDYRGREADLARSLDVRLLEARIDALRSRLAETGGMAGAAEGDWIAGFVARFSGFGDALVRDLYALLAALGIELVAALAVPAAVRLVTPVASKATEEPQDTAAPMAASVEPNPGELAPVLVFEPQRAQPATQVRPLGDLAQFADGCLDRKVGMTVTMRDLYGAYLAWCADHGFSPVPDLTFRRVFAQLCDAVGYRTTKRGNAVRLIDVGLKHRAA